MNSKGLEIFCKSWMPKLGDQIKGVLFFCHGYGDTCTFFFEGLLTCLVVLYIQFIMFTVVIKTSRRPNIGRMDNLAIQVLLDT